MSMFAFVFLQSRRLEQAKRGDQKPDGCQEATISGSQLGAGSLGFCYDLQHTSNRNVDRPQVASGQSMLPICG